MGRTLYCWEGDVKGYFHPPVDLSWEGDVKGYFHPPVDLSAFLVL